MAFPNCSSVGTGEDSARSHRLDSQIGVPSSSDSRLSLTDFYQVTMSYAYWKNNKHNDHAVFEMYFRKCPFDGEFAVLAGIDEVLRFINDFHFTDDEIGYLRKTLPHVEEEFLQYLSEIDGSRISLHAISEGTLVFPREPLLRVEGPLCVCQLLETPLLNLMNFPTLIATNAARYRLSAGWNKQLVEFGARRAQGPDGAMSASRYAYLGGFDATSNVRAGLSFGIPISGTHAHSFVTCFSDLSDLRVRSLGECEDFISLVLEKRSAVYTLWEAETIVSKINMSELAAFIAYAQASIPVALYYFHSHLHFCAFWIHSIHYIQITSKRTVEMRPLFSAARNEIILRFRGLPNFLCVAFALYDLNYKPVGIRLDSGDLAYLSKEVRKKFVSASAAFNVPFEKLKIVASNNINEKVLKLLNEEGNEVDAFGIGTHLVTCQSQPALGMVYKIVELNLKPCMKLSQDFDKITMPASKAVYRLYSSSGSPIIDLLDKTKNLEPVRLQKIFCRHLFDETKRCYVIPDKVAREKCIEALKLFRKDHLRLINPTPYKISASESYYEYFRRIWSLLTPVDTIS
ncbi:nicotinate phosphoribosyltransferase [Cardiosporidium cionae]|uniref:nicotinate phosphoribosyltransferase n=1 Tax=Cardiosporidium cionae TaxID=476202 RepID=A0ABQ7J6V5_9APIC|nr:nicotinate phosphoribosyltransferase [Cardiosporidium cionae]|eukprot:KAF8819712.1 nicotinate phosphoribosyltransferase [Cardiosporidium cionae]